MEFLIDRIIDFIVAKDSEIITGILFASLLLLTIYVFRRIFVKGRSSSRRYQMKHSMDKTIIGPQLNGDPAGYSGILFVDHARHFHPPSENVYSIPPEHFQYLFRMGEGSLYIAGGDTFEIHTRETKFQYRFEELGKLFINKGAIVLIPLFDNRLTLLFLTSYAPAIRECIEQGHSFA